jgi:hypothetical protein
MFQRTIASEIEIDAPVEHVWEILVDLQSYPEWNPFTIKVESTLQPGDPVVLFVKMAPMRMIVQREQVSVCEPPHRLAWGLTMGLAFLLVTHREQLLIPKANGKTVYQTSDDFRGLLVPLVLWLYGDAIQKGFDSLARALKQHAEQRFVVKRR